MKKAAPYIIGFISGIIFYYIVNANTDNVPDEPYDGLYGLTEFSEKAECVPTGGIIEVFQVLKPNMALAHTGKYSDGPMVLLINYDGKTYYDEQKIKVPADKCARQIGTYQYTSSVNRQYHKTLPAVVIE